MRYAPEHKQETRTKILKEAAKAIRRDGPHDLSLSGVMASVGLTNGGFYSHFKSRDDLLAGGVAQMFRESRARATLEREGDPRANLGAFLDFYLSPTHRDARAFGCPLAFLSTEAPRLPKPAARQFADGIASLIDMLAVNLAAIGRAEARDEASALLSELVGAVALSRAEPDRQASDLILQRSRRMAKRRLDV